MSMIQADKDMRRSSIFGPMQVIISTLSYAILYPLILSKSGLEVLGLWSFVVSMSLYMGLSDVGFSITLTRKLSRSSRDKAVQSYPDYATAIWFYKFISLALCVFWLMGQVWIYEFLPKIYDANAFVIVVLVLIVGSSQQLIAQMDAAVLTGIHETYITKLVGGVLPLVRLSIGALGAYWARPLEGICAAILIENIFKSVLFRARIRQVLPGWAAEYRRTPIRQYIRHIGTMMRDGRHIYMISLGNLLREPIFRIIIMVSLGYAAAGVYDIVKRIPDLIRSLLVGGSQSYLPAYARLAAANDYESTEKLTQKLVLMLCAGGALLLGGYYACGDLLLNIWLPQLPEGAFADSRIMCIWASITLVNVPYWFFMQAAHRERLAAASLWLHTVSVLALFPLKAIADIDLSQMLLYWCLTSLFSQSLLYYYVQREFGFFWRTISRMLPAVLVAVVIVMCINLARGALSGRQVAPIWVLATSMCTGAMVWTLAIFSPLYSEIRDNLKFW